MQDLTTFIAHNMPLVYAFAIILVLVMLVEFLRLKRNNFSIGTHEAVQLMNREHAVVIDIRAQDQFRQGHIIDAISMSATELSADARKLDKFKNKPLILICNTGIETQKLAALLRKKGYNSYSFTGGMRTWQEADMPVIKENNA